MPVGSKHLSWLHLSDFHLRPRPGDNSRATRDHERCLTALETDIAEFRSNAGPTKPVQSPDLVFVSGDVVQSGGDKEMFECAHSWMERFCGAAGVTRDRVFLVPGNHDLDRSCVPDAHKSLLNLSEYGTGQFWEEVDRIWDSEPTLTELSSKFAAHETFAERYGHVRRAGLGSWRTALKINGIAIDLLGINTVWTGGTDELDRPGFPVVGGPQREGLDEIALAEETDLTLVLQHNPTSYLHSIDALQHANWLDALDSIVYCGHLHQSAMGERRSMRGRHLELMGGALYAGYADRRRYTMGTLEVTPADRRFSIALRAADGDIESVFGRDTHRYPGARKGVAQFEQPADAANLGHHPPHQDQLEIEYERDHLEFDGSHYHVRIEKKYYNPTDRPWTHIDALVLANAFPDDPVRSRQLYHERPLELEALGFSARQDGREITYAVLHDLDSSKELHLVLTDDSGRLRGLGTGESTVLDYSFTIDRERWGPYFERHIRRPTRRIECELVFPLGSLGALELVANRHITDRTLGSELEVREAGGKQIWRWENDGPRLQSRYRFMWRFKGET
jgi:predicted phosphodiesterase